MGEPSSIYSIQNISKEIKDYMRSVQLQLEFIHNTKIQSVDPIS